MIILPQDDVYSVLIGDDAELTPEFKAVLKDMFKCECPLNSKPLNRGSVTKFRTASVEYGPLVRDTHILVAKPPPWVKERVSVVR